MPPTVDGTSHLKAISSQNLYDFNETIELDNFKYIKQNVFSP